MKRFNHDYDDEDDFQDENLFSDTEDDNYDEIIMSQEQYAEMMAKQEAINFMQLELVQLDLNQRLLFKTMKIVKKNTWFFSFRSKKKQLEIIAATYQFLKNLVVQNVENKMN